MPNQIRWLFLLIFLFTHIPSYAKNRGIPEQIKSYVSQITIETNASLDVTETLIVTTNLEKIRHGLVRWLPLHYMDQYGVNHQLNYQIKQILINNTPALYQIKKSANNLILHIGDRNSYLNPGTYTYIIHYKVKNTLNFLPTSDQLAWNITGNSWDLPINKVQAIIQTPVGANIEKYQAYTGKLTNQTQNYQVIQLAPNKLAFSTNQALKPGEGFSISIFWPKGYLSANLKLLPTPVHSQPNLALKIGILFLSCSVLIWLACRFKRSLEKDSP